MRLVRQRDVPHRRAMALELIQEFSKILMAGGMSTALEDQIYNYVSNTTNITYNTTAPSDSERRNRVRAILYLIAVSPEHAIQR